MRSRRTLTFALAALVVAGLAVAAARVAKPRRGAAACSGTLSGAVRGSFGCTMTAFERATGGVKVVLEPAGLPPGVGALVPGEFEIAPPVGTARAYGLGELAKAQLLLSTSAHQTFLATKRKDQTRGQVTVRLSRYEAPRDHEGAPVVAGSLEARLVPGAPDASGEVVVQVQF